MHALSLEMWVFSKNFYQRRVTMCVNSLISVSSSHKFVSHSLRHWPWRRICRGRGSLAAISHETVDFVNRWSAVWPCGLPSTQTTGYQTQLFEVEKKWEKTTQVLLVNVKTSYQTVEEVRGESWNAQRRHNRWQETGRLRGQQMLPWVLPLVNVFLTYCNFFLLNGGKGKWGKMSDFLQVSSTESVFKNLAKGVEGRKALIT